MPAPTALSWVAEDGGWGLKQYRARATGRAYVARKTGGRHFGWELRVVLPDGTVARRTSATKLKSCKEIAEIIEERGFLDKPGDINPHNEGGKS